MPFTSVEENLEAQVSVWFHPLPSTEIYYTSESPLTARVATLLVIKGAQVTLYAGTLYEFSTVFVDCGQPEFLFFGCTKGTHKTWRVDECKDSVRRVFIARQKGFHG